MTEEQKKLLKQIIDDLTTSCRLLNDLANPFFGLNEAYVKQAMQLAELLSTFLGQWEKLRDLANQVASAHKLDKGLYQIEALTLATVLKTIESEIMPLQTQSQQHIETLTIALQKNLLKEKPAQLAFKALSQLCLDFHTVCDKEITSLKALCTTTQVAPKAINLTLMLITGPIKIEKETIQIPQSEQLFEFELSSASNALCEMHNKYGIVAIKRINMTNLPISERELIYNAPLRLLGRYPLGLCGRTVISSSTCEHRLLASYAITKEKTITIRFEQYAPIVIHKSFNTIVDVKNHLITQYKLKAIEEVDTSWQLEELIQVSDAFGKLAKRPQDVITLTGCTLIRIKESPDDDPDAKVGGTYKPGPHSLTLTNTAFASSTERFFGTGITLCPYSHGIILHEVGHIIEFHDWQAQKKQSNEGILDIEVQMEKCKQLIPRYAKQLKEVALACDQEMEQFRQEAENEQSKLLKALEAAKQEFTAIRQHVRSSYGQAIDVYNNACDDAPKDKSQAAIAFSAFLKQLHAMLTALHQIDFSNRDLSEADLKSAIAVWKATQEAETTFRETLTGIVPEYAYIAFNAMSLMGQVLDSAKLYPQIMHEEQILRNNYRQRFAADEQKEDELVKQHKTAIATATKIWSDEQELYLTLMQKSLSTRIGAVKDAQRMYQERKPTPCLQKFIDFVTTHNIGPITVYAKQEWDQGNKSEFFAESYHLFLNDPEFLQTASLDLYTWFEEGKYM